MQSTVIKRSIAIAGHKTSVSLEDAFWRGLKEISKNCRTSLPDLVDKIDAVREHSNLSSAIRLFVLDYFRRASVTKTVMSRRRDHLIDKKIGSVIRMKRVKLGMSQGELGKGLGVTFQTIKNTRTAQTRWLRPASPICVGSSKSHRTICSA